MTLSCITKHIFRGKIVDLPLHEGPSSEEKSEERKGRKNPAIVSNSTTSQLQGMSNSAVLHSRGKSSLFASFAAWWFTPQIVPSCRSCKFRLNTRLPIFACLEKLLQTGWFQKLGSNYHHHYLGSFFVFCFTFTSRAAGAVVLTQVRSTFPSSLIGNSSAFSKMCPCHWWEDNLYIITDKWWWRKW